MRPRTSWEEYEREIELENERTRKALDFANEHRRPVVLTRKELLKLFGAVLLAAAFVAYVLWLPEIAGWLGRIW